MVAEEGPLAREKRQPMPPAKAQSGSYLSGIILAAGASTRMGRPKQLLSLDGQPLLQHVLEQAVASCLDEVILVLGHQAREVRAAIRVPSRRRIRVVVNRDYAGGQSTSLRLGLRSASPRAAAAAILLADQPQITAGLIDRLAAAFRSADRPLLRPVYLDAQGRRVPGHPVFLARQIWFEVEQLSGDQGARALLTAHPDSLLELPLEGGPPADIDTWEDYRRAADAQALAIRQ